VWVTATIDGQVVSWINNWLGETAIPSGTASVTPSVQMVTATIDGQVVSWPNNWFGAPTSISTPKSAPVSAVARPAKVENAGLLLEFQDFKRKY
jgi:hypothetical protein